MNHPDDFNDPLERNMKTLLAPQDPLPHLSQAERDTMFAGIRDSRLRRPGRWFVMLCVALGIVMPLATIALEWFTKVSSTIFYSPMPTIGHALLCATVPAVNLLLFLHLKKRLHLPRALRSALAGLSVAIALFYVGVLLPFLPIVGMGLLFIVVVIGLLALLPLSPHFGGLFTILLSRRIARVDGHAHRGLIAAGFALGLLLAGSFTFVHDQRVRTLDQAIAELPDVAPATLARLDHLVSADWLRTGVATPPTPITGLMDSRWESGSWKRRAGIQKVYYALHGHLSEPHYQKPWQAAGRHHWIGWQRDKVRLAGSELEGWADSEAGVGYVEWTQTFVNYRTQAAEGRQHIELPPGGVVSRVTLWVNGEPREAAFDTVAKTRAAYEYVVARKRDPVLVNAIGRDKIQVECFPIPAIKDAVPGRMKFRLGITFPLPLDGLAQTRLRLPRILDRNFSMAEDLEHQLQLECQHPIKGMTRSGSLSHTATFAPTFAAKNHDGSRVQSTTPDTVHTLIIPRESTAPGALCEDTIEGGWVRSTVRQKESQALERIAIVVDRDGPMEAHLEGLRDLETHLPEGVSVRWFMEGDRPLEAASFGGGGDAVPVLLDAGRWAGEADKALVLWFHGVQPGEYAALADLKTLLELKRDRLDIHCVELVPGGNYVADSLSIHELATRHAAPQSPQTAFENVLTATGMNPGGHVWQIDRLDPERDPDPNPATADLLPTRLELAKLKAHEEILSALGSPDADAQRDAMAARAVRYQLVTPVSGAIVMETREDYQKHGLKPPEDAPQAHAVPEPGTALMLLLGAGLLFGMRRFLGRTASRPW